MSMLTLLTTVTATTRELSIGGRRVVAPEREVSLLTSSLAWGLGSNTWTNPWQGVRLEVRAAAGAEWKPLDADVRWKPGRTWKTARLKDGTLPEDIPEKVDMVKVLVSLVHPAEVRLFDSDRDKQVDNELLARPWCPPGQFSDDQLQTCAPCIIIGHCQAENTRCTSKEDRWCEQCSRGFRWDGTESECTKCQHKTEDACEISSIECDITGDATCVCKAGFHGTSDEGSERSAECMPCSSMDGCHETALWCTDKHKSHCREFVDEISKRKGCMAGYHYDRGGCLKCKPVDNCVKVECEDGAESSCTECQPQYELQDERCWRCNNPSQPCNVRAACDFGKHPITVQNGNTRGGIPFSGKEPLSIHGLRVR